MKGETTNTLKNQGLALASELLKRSRDMINLSVVKKNTGVTLIELLVVISIIGILSVIGVPQYQRFAASSKVKRAANELLQNMRLARTMAIKENRPYLITLNEGVVNTYIIGFDGNNNNSLLDGADGYENGGVRVINLQNEYGINVVLGSANFTTNPPNGPNGIGINDAVFFRFNPDGSATPNGTAYFQHSSADRGYSYCIELANPAGMINLFMWQGNADDTANPGWTEVR